MSFTTNQMTEFFQVDRATLGRWRRAGADVAYTGRNTWHGKKLLDWYIAQHKEAIIEADPGIIKERQRLIKARADREELKRDSEKGQTLEGQEVYDRLREISRTFRDQILAIPDRCSAQLSATRDHHKVHQILSVEIRHALTELFDKVETFRKPQIKEN